MNEKYLIDIRAWAPGSVIQIPENMDVRDVVLVRDKRSPMIRLLDDPAWRERLKVAETPLTTSSTFTLFTDGTGRYFDYAGDEIQVSRT